MHLGSHANTGYEIAHGTCEIVNEPVIVSSNTRAVAETADIDIYHMFTFLLFLCVL